MADTVLCSAHAHFAPSPGHSLSPRKISLANSLVCNNDSATLVLTQVPDKKPSNVVHLSQLASAGSADGALPAEVAAKSGSYVLVSSTNSPVLNACSP